MKQEEKYLEKLFQNAREEDPHLSFEEVSETFLESVPPTLFGNFKDWFFQNISLNSIVILGIGTFVSSLLYFSKPTPTTTESKEVTPSIVTIHPSESSSLQSSEKEENVLLAVLEKTKSADNNNNFSTKNNNSNPTIKTSKTVDNQPVTLNKTETSKKKRISQSPILAVLPTEKNVVFLKKEEPLKIDNNQITKSPKRILIPKKTRKTSSSATFSPWVVGEGKTHPDWTFSQNQEYFKRGKNSKILQLFLDNKNLEKVFEKDEQGNYLPLTIVANYHFSENNFVFFKGKPISIVQEPLIDDLEKNKEYITITKFKTRKNKAILKFNYQDYKVFIQLKKVNRNWQYHKLKMKNSTGTDVDVTF